MPPTRPDSFAAETPGKAHGLVVHGRVGQEADVLEPQRFTLSRGIVNQHRVRPTSAVGRLYPTRRYDITTAIGKRSHQHDSDEIAADGQGGTATQIRRLRVSGSQAIVELEYVHNPGCMKPGPDHR